MYYIVHVILVEFACFFGFWYIEILYWKNLNYFATCFGNGIVIWISNNLNVFGGFVLKFVCDVIKGFFLVWGEIWMGLLRLIS